MGTCGIIKHLSAWRKNLFSPCRKHCPHRCVLLLKTNMFSRFTRHCFIHPSGSGTSALSWLLIHHKMLYFAVYFAVDVEQNWISVSGVSFGVSLQLENQSDTLCTYTTDAAKKKKYFGLFLMRILEEARVYEQYSWNADSPSSQLNCALLSSCSLVKYLPRGQKASPSVPFVDRSVQRE